MRKLKRFWAALMACLMMAVMLCSSGCIIIVSDKAVEDGVDVVSLINFKDFRMRFCNAGLVYGDASTGRVILGRNGEGRRVDIPSTIEGEPVVEIYESAFSCTNIVKVKMGENIVIIADNAFYNCNDLKKIELEGNVAIIGSNAFYDCDKLKKVTIGEKVFSIGAYAFSNCDKLKKITIPENVTYIDTNAFRACDKLEKVTFEEKVGWNINGKMIDSSLLADKEKAAELLKVGYVWRRN